YQLWDSTAGNGGHWAVNGGAQRGNQIINVTAVPLAQNMFLSGAGSSDPLARANNRIDSSAWEEFHAHASINQPAVVTPTSLAVTLSAFHTIAASTLFMASDADGDTIIQYDLWDNGAGGGRWQLNGTALAASQDNIVSAPQLAQVSYQSGTGT